MMQEFEIKFVCPKCGQKKMAEIRHSVESKTVARTFLVSSGGKGKFGIIGKFAGLTEGKVQRYCCESCGFIPMNTVGMPVKNPRSLFAWLKKNGMLAMT